MRTTPRKTPLAFWMRRLNPITCVPVMLEEFAVGKVYLGRRPARRVVDDPAVRAHEPDDVGTRQAGEPILQQTKDLLAGESGAELVGGGDAERCDPVLQLGDHE